MFPNRNSKNNLAKEDKHQLRRGFRVNCAEMECGGNGNGVDGNKDSNALENTLKPGQLFSAVSPLGIAGRPTTTARFEIHLGQPGQGAGIKRKLAEAETEDIFGYSGKRRQNGGSGIAMVDENSNNSVGINGAFGNWSPDFETINPGQYEDNMDLTEASNTVAVVDAIPTQGYGEHFFEVDVDYEIDNSSTQGVIDEDEMGTNRDQDFESDPEFGDDYYDPEFDSDDAEDEKLYYS